MVICILYGVGNGTSSNDDFIMRRTSGDYFAGGGFVGVVDVDSFVRGCGIELTSYRFVVVREVSILFTVDSDGGFCGKNLGRLENCFLKFRGNLRILICVHYSSIGGGITIGSANDGGTGVGGFVGINYGVCVNCDALFCEHTNVTIGDEASYTNNLGIGNAEGVLQDRGGAGGFCGCIVGGRIERCRVKFRENNNVLIGFVALTLNTVNGSVVGGTKWIDGVRGGIGGFYGLGYGDMRIDGCESEFINILDARIGFTMNINEIASDSIIACWGYGPFDVIWGIGGFGGLGMEIKTYRSVR